MKKLKTTRKPKTSMTVQVMKRKKKKNKKKKKKRKKSLANAEVLNAIQNP